MAMGDTNAVAFGQCAHLSVVLRTDAFELEDFLRLKQRPIRRSVRCGLMIDDFVVLEVHKGREAPTIVEEETEGRRRMLKVREAYVSAGLPRHEGKAVEQEEKGESWSYEVDGKRGQLEAPDPPLLCFVQSGGFRKNQDRPARSLSWSTCSSFSVPTKVDVGFARGLQSSERQG